MDRRTPCVVSIYCALTREHDKALDPHRYESFVRMYLCGSVFCGYYTQEAEGYDIKSEAG